MGSPPRMTIGQAMRKARKDREWSLEWLSIKSGINKNMIIAYERDRVSPGILNLVALADTLRVGLDEYIGRQTPP